MKLPLALYIGISVLSFSLLSACGQPGPLYLPKIAAKPAANSTPAVAPAAPPAPFLPIDPEP